MHIAFPPWSIRQKTCRQLQELLLWEVWQVSAHGDRLRLDAVHHARPLLWFEQFLTEVSCEQRRP